jgi:putative phage-type endonuclease
MSRPYHIIDVNEGTDAWREWRQGGIGSSDASTIMGENPFKTAAGLFLEKQQPKREAERNFARTQGRILEPIARAQYCIQAGLQLEPACVQNLERPWLRASLDGISADGEHLVEIKCGPSAYRRAADSLRPSRNHLGQLQHVLAVTGRPVIDIWYYFSPNPPVRLEVRRDEGYIKRLLIAEEAFWKRLTGSTRA